MPKRPSSKQRRFVFLTLSLIVFGMAYYTGNRYSDNTLPAIAGVLLRPPHPLPEFQLSSRDDTRFDQSQLEGSWSLLSFAEQTAQPSPLLRLTQVHNRFSAEPELQQQLRFIYIDNGSDPARHVMLEQIGERFLILQGDPATLQEMRARFGATQGEEEAPLFLIGPGGRIHALFTSFQEGASIAADIKTLINHYR
ncbi:SCO family protein [endosymbiont of Ridgeia piscesae]|jgi:cytochrome oxidase Cu insertion factor (SCO1/SenC/PrrC family)|uniref:Cytochrome oxidase Cu insertion factor, SCO1/SenC/PrrC family n=1 Tax=endosymbiont of Ridgeia piscesae TaxID=54398 RepID=A0A0T5Z048_9GAMM|nr:SCO family protein [endosymbiont of Ridgeia piscesae]KRT56049.1 hypothetical protein Ga0074115_13032 [endosymbiont of Ridgeia piscesae]KRT57233.1 Cytochrome oxidase Cu insertion factor, SCO1/SenC/PrrC family [endosymbiont of Ridgeia piscesae]